MRQPSDIAHDLMHPMLSIAVKAARRAGTIINRASLDLDRIEIRTKQTNDFVTEVDRASEDAIIEIIRETYPEHAILAEESGAIGESEHEWIIDPLDGTTNFIHGFPQYSISIAYAQAGLVQHAVVFDPNRNELFTASRGRGAFLNDRRIRVSKRIRLAEALIGTGFPYRVFEHADAFLAIFRELTEKTAGIRRPGSAALDLCYVASGRYDAFFELGLAPWDFAAGALMVQEAGGLVSDFAGEGNYFKTGNIIAGSPKIFAQLMQVINTHRGNIEA